MSALADHQEVMKTMILSSLKRSYEMFSTEPPHAVSADFAPSQRIKIAAKIAAEFTRTRRASAAAARRAARTGRARRAASIGVRVTKL